jgi:hypothetical protein
MWMIGRQLFRSGSLLQTTSHYPRCRRPSAPLTLDKAMAVATVCKARSHDKAVGWTVLCYTCRPAEGHQGWYDDPSLLSFSMPSLHLVALLANAIIYCVSCQPYQKLTPKVKWAKIVGLVSDSRYNRDSCGSSDFGPEYYVSLVQWGC